MAKDKYILMASAAVLIIVFTCTVGSFSTNEVNGNGITEITGVISSPSASQNGTVFKITDLGGNEIRCFYGAGMPEMPILCKLTGSFSSDGNMFFVDKIVVDGKW
ncbi:MAG: hypothetical protein FWH44_03330 [Methanomassiliicoccaceae archaeon]|nr:hypothetical protein [Methanomassiliicoccaceae archaeon]